MTTTMQTYPDIDINIDTDTMDLGSEAENTYMDEDMNFPVNSNSGNNLDVDQDVELQDARSETARGSQAGEPDYFMADLDEINYSDEEIVDADEDAEQSNVLADEEITDVPDQQDIIDVETELVSLVPDNTHANEEPLVQTDESSKPLATGEKPVDWDQDIIDYSDDEAAGEDVSERPAVNDDAISIHPESFEHTDGPTAHSDDHALGQDSLRTTEEGHEESAQQDFDESAGQSYDDTLGQDFGVFDEQAYDGYGEQLDEYAGQEFDDGEESHQKPDLLDDERVPGDDNVSAHTTAELEGTNEGEAAVPESEEHHEQDYEGSVKDAQEDVVGQDFEEFAQETYAETAEQQVEDDAGHDEENPIHGESNEFGEYASEETLGHAPEEESKEDLNNFDFQQAYDETTELDQPFEQENEGADQYNSNELAETTYDESTTLAGLAEEQEHEDSADVNDEEDAEEGLTQTAEYPLNDEVDQFNDNVETGLSNHESDDTEQPPADAGAVSFDEAPEGASGNTTDHEHEHELEHDHNSTAEAGWDEAEDESANSGDQASSAEHEDSEHQSAVDTGDAGDDFATESLHPVSVRYDGHEMMLFPLQTSATNHTYLLSDESVAHGTILELFQACRECLGDSVGENVELRLELPGLKLEFSEDYISCNSISLSKIINIYKQLKAADGEQDPPPLEMILKKCENALSARLAWLEECADTNLGFLASQEQEQDGIEQPANNDEHNEDSDEEYGDESNSNEGEDQLEETSDKHDQHGSKRTFVEFEEEEEEAVDEETSSPKRVKTTD